VRATGGRRTLELTRRFAPRPCGAHFARPNRLRRFVESSPFDHSGTSP